jgi:hypothetical protein
MTLWGVCEPSERRVMFHTLSDSDPKHVKKTAVDTYTVSSCAFSKYNVLMWKYISLFAFIMEKTVWYKNCWWQRFNNMTQGNCYDCILDLWIVNEWINEWMWPLWLPLILSIWYSSLTPLPLAWVIGCYCMQSQRSSCEVISHWTPHCSVCIMMTWLANIYFQGLNYKKG